MSDRPAVVRRRSAAEPAPEPAAPTVRRRRAATAEPAAATAAAPRAVGRRRSGTPSADASTQEYGWGRRAAAGAARPAVERASRRRPVYRRDQTFDPPLPEDIAFRSPAEGGDRTLLHARRRRAVGLRDDERVLMAGPRSLTGWIFWGGVGTEATAPALEGEPEGTFLDRMFDIQDAGVPDAVLLAPVDSASANPASTNNAVPTTPTRRSRTAAAPTVEPALLPVEAGDAVSDAGDDSGDGDSGSDSLDGAAPRRRRRGRRGGRGRRRGGAPEVLPEDASPSDEAAAYADTVGEPAGVASDRPRAARAAAHLDGSRDDDEAQDRVLIRDRHAARLDAEERPVIMRRPRLSAASPSTGTSAAPAESAPAAAAPEPSSAVAVPSAAVATESVAPEPATAEPAIPEKPAVTRRRRAARPAAESEVSPAPLVESATLPAAFSALGIAERTLIALARLRYERPTPIQEQAIPMLLGGKDVVGIAQTGSGKTVAFGVPMVERLDAALPEVQGIVLVPTRELAQQVLDVLTNLAEPWGMGVIGLLGGHAVRGDIEGLSHRPHIVVGTPGRILDHLQRGTLSLTHVCYAVLDEADQMLDIGFLPDIRRILSRTPKRRQTALFSATMPSTIRRLIWQFMRDPEQVAVDAVSTPVDTITQVYFEVASRDKAAGLRELVAQELRGRTLVFCKTKRAVDHLEATLSRQGVRVGALHGDMDQRRRDRVVRDFREGTLDILVATNVAARGLDIPEITHVLNYDVPQNVEEYVHRIGRTGRAGREGKAITFVSEWDMQEFDAILHEFGDRLQKGSLSIYGAATHSA